MQLDLPDPQTGVTKRQGLEAACEQAARMGKAIPQPEEPQIPEGWEHVWEAFWELNQLRGSDGFGPCAITLQEIDAYSRMVTCLSPREAKAIRTMDAAYLEEVAQIQRDRQQRQRRKGGSRG